MPSHQSLLTANSLSYGITWSQLPSHSCSDFPLEKQKYDHRPCNCIHSIRLFMPLYWFVNKFRNWWKLAAQVNYFHVCCWSGCVEYFQKIPNLRRVKKVSLRSSRRRKWGYRPWSYIFAGVSTFQKILKFLDPLTSIGNNSTQENSPRNSPDFAMSPARLSWPACSKHTAACMHRFFHILGRLGEPAVWFMSESGAVGSWQARTYVGLSITSSGFETAAGVRGLRYLHFKLFQYSYL